MANKPVTTTFSEGERITASKLNTLANQLATAVENGLGRGGTAESPNSMQGDLDLNTHDILNVGNLHASDVVLDGVGLVATFQAIEDSKTAASISEINAANSAQEASTHANDAANSAAEASTYAANAANVVDAHNADTAAHSATPSATPNRIIMRDVNGRAKVNPPSDAYDIVTKGYMDAHANDPAPHSGHTTDDEFSAHTNDTAAHSATPLATANRIIMRDISGRAKVAAPSAADDIARKDTVDAHATAVAPHSGHTTDSEFDAHTNSTSAHLATSTATASRIILRDSSGRAQVATPSAANDIANKAYVDSMSSGDIVSVKDFGAVGNGVADDTAAFQAAVNAVGDGDIYVPDGAYKVTGLSLSGYIRWRLKNATVNGTETPQLPGMWVGFPERFFGDNAGSTGSFRYASATRHYRLAGGVGHTEGLHVENDVNTRGNAGEMTVGINGTAKTNSKGSVFGINGYAKALSSSTSIGTEVVGGEVNTDVNCPTVTRKVGFQIVDVAGSTGTGTTHDYGEALIKQGSTATGFNVGYQIGYDGQPEEFPVRDTATSRIFRVGGNETNKVAIGFDFGYVRYGHAAIQLYSQKEGQVIGWGPNGNASNTAGMIRSDCPDDNGGALIFISGGLALQDGARNSAINILSGTNPVNIVVDSVSKQVTQGATDSGGVGYRVLRVPN